MSDILWFFLPLSFRSLQNWNKWHLDNCTLWIRYCKHALVNAKLIMIELFKNTLQFLRINLNVSWARNTCNSLCFESVRIRLPCQRDKWVNRTMFVLIAYRTHSSGLLQLVWGRHRTEELQVLQLYKLLPWRYRPLVRDLIMPLIQISLL